MKILPPIAFSADLTDDRLTVIAEQLLDVRYETIDLLNTALDDSYVKETAVYGRQRSMLIQLSLSRQYDWLSLLHAGMDVTFAIGSIPCRFFTDDPLHPSKGGFFKKNSTDDLFSTDDQVPVTWRFIVSKSNGESDSQVYFIGYNFYDEKLCEWVHSQPNRSLYSADDFVPESVEIPSAQVALRDKEAEKNAADKDNVINPDTAKK